MVIVEVCQRAALQELFALCFFYLALIEPSVVIRCLQGLSNGWVIEHFPISAKG